jgi:hypothetical protein
MSEETRNRLYLREGSLLLGFVLLLVASLVSVLVPELAKEPEGDSRPSTADETPAR